MDSRDGAIYYEIQGTKLIVQWQNLERYYNHGDYTFQAILDNDDSSIRFNYLAMNPDLYGGGPEYYDSPTVGLNKGDGTEYEEYLYDSGYSSTKQGIYPVTGTTILYYIGAPPPMGVSIDGPDEVDEGTSAGFLGSIVGYGVGTPATYSIDDTLIEPFIDALGGTLLRTSGDDSYSTTTLPFDFEFFGVQYYAGRTIYVSTNGYMDFGSPNTDHTDYSNDNIPSTTDPENYVAPFWDDLRLWSGDGAAIYVDTGVSAGHAYMVIEWYNIAHYYHYFDGAGLTFEVILWDNNVIDFRYGDVTCGSSSYNYGRSATVGLENQDGSDGALYSYNTASLVSGMNIRFEFLPPGGTGYAWYDGSTLLESGTVTDDPFYTSLSYAFPDGPAIASLDLVATFDGVPIDAATHTVTVNNIPPSVSIDQGSTETMDLGETVLIDGDIDDVPADTYTFWEEVTPGIAGIDWTITPTTPSSTLDEFGYDFAPIRPGVYTLTVYAMDDDGDSDMDSLKLQWKSHKVLWRSSIWRLYLRIFRLVV
jgi:hypothetical protein